MPKYLVNGESVELELDPEYVAVKFKAARRSTMASAVSDAGDLGDYRNRIEVPEFGLTLLPTAPTTMAAARSENAIRSMRSSAAVSQAGMVFRRGKTRIVPTGRILLAFSEDADDATREQILSDYGLKPITQSDYGEITAESTDANADIFAISERLSALGQVKFAEPDLITITPRRSLRALPPRDFSNRPITGTFFGMATPMARPQPQPTAAGADPMLSQQYYLDLLQAEAATGEVTPSPDIVVAILDEGVDTTHPDLGRIIRSYDGTDDDEFQEPNANDAHGTACAGIVGATASNNLGIRGVAAGCSMFAVRIAYSDNTGENWVTTNAWIARSIDWSWEQGADVLSNSWGGGSPSNLIIRAFDRARTQGRAGRGATIVIAAGNDDSPVDFPGNLDDVLTVSASNQDDEPKTKTSSDGEYWWGSNHGPEVDVAAPGVGIATTDITGDRGYNRSGNAGDYVLNFNGTSSACPQAAAVCALVLSNNANLSEAEVRTILRETADKIGSVIYDPATGHSVRMGQGRVNALKAVRRAKPQIESGTEFDRFPNIAIPDADSAGITDGVEVMTTGIVSGIEVEVDIDHSYRGDLRVSLVPPDGAMIALHNREGGSAHDLKALYTPANSPALATWLQTRAPAIGIWALQVVDLASWDVGQLNRWRLKLDVDAPEKQLSTIIVPTNGSIPDNQPSGIQSQAELNLAGSITEVSVMVEITHTWRGDLEVSLSHSGHTIQLHERKGGSQQNLFETFTTDNSALSSLLGEEASGVWTLHVADHASHDTGKLARWSLEVKVE